MSFVLQGRDDSDVTIYTPGQARAIALLVAAGVISIFAVLSGVVYYVFFIKRTKTYHRTNILPYLVSLLVANVLQAIATIMNIRWTHEGIVYDGGYCMAQGALKNAANNGIALWSFMIALHVFNLLFLRWHTTRAGMAATLVGGWSAVGMIVLLGPSVFENPDKGSYFGVSGYWCWITDAYPAEQTYMEYFFEFMSAGLGFVLYSLVLLRVRGNLTQIEGKWRLRWIPSTDAWRLAFSRDYIDSSMLKVATSMVWYPVAYSLIIIPVALARLSSFTGHSVPFWAVVATDTIFNLTGLVNTLLFVATRRLLPDMTSLPHFTTQRNGSMSTSESKYGVTPFSLGDAVAAPVIPVCLSPDAMRSRDGHEYSRDSDLNEEKHDRDDDVLSVDSLNLHPPPLVLEDSMRRAYGLPSVNAGAGGRAME